MKITFLTLFPQMFTGVFENSILKRAQDKGLVQVNYVNIRDFGLGKHQVVDDTPYGGGIGMVMRVDMLHRALVAAKDPQLSSDEQRVVLLDARGETYTQTVAHRYTKLTHLIFLCGHYEGVDERIREYVDETISIGDYILTGGEIPSMAIADSVIRLLPGVITEQATVLESFTQNLLEFPQYTRPQLYEGQHVPDILTSGNHGKIDAWRKEQSLILTKKHRPDLLRK